jgi:hypothetical protein
MSTDVDLTGTYLATFTVNVGMPMEFGGSADVTQWLVPIIDGKVEGPQLNGIVQADGAYCTVVCGPRMTVLEVRYVIETVCGERIYVNDFETLPAGSEECNRMLLGEAPDAAPKAFRSGARLISSGPNWSWLNARTFRAVGQRHPDQIRLDVFILDF